MKSQSAYSFSNIWKIAYPVILGSLAQDIITVVDTAFIGRLGAIPLGAVAIGGIFYLAIIMLAWGFGLGIQIMISRRYGEGQKNQINSIFIHSFIILFGLSVMLFSYLSSQIPNLLAGIIDSDAIRLESQRFLSVRIFGLFAAFININFRAFYIGIGKTKIIGHTTVVMAITNIVLDYVLIFGKLNFPAMGIEGAAWASVISEYVALIYFFLFTNYNKTKTEFGLFKKVNLSRMLIFRIFKLSFPTMLQHLISFGAWFLFFVFVEKMGEIPLAISNIIRSIYIILLIPIMGFAAATNTLVSYAIGRKEHNMVFNVCLKSLGLAWAGVLFIALVSSFIPEQIIGLYTDSEQLIQQSLPVFKVVLVASFLLSYGFIFFQALAGTGNTLTALFIEAVTIAIYLAGIYLLINKFKAEISTIWMMEVFYGFAVGTISLLYLKWANWSKKRI